MVVVAADLCRMVASYVRQYECDLGKLSTANDCQFGT